MVSAGHDLIHGPLSRNTAHLCLDMQNLFARGAPWETPWMERVLPCVVRIVERMPHRTIFTRFVPAKSAEDEIGTWRRYYRRWAEVTLARLAPGYLDLLPELARFQPPATIVEKRRLSAFSSPELASVLNYGRIDTLIMTGAETDVCVLASVLGAVDRGYRVILVEDAICSSSDDGHDALMTLYRTRFSEQIELVETDALLEALHTAD